MVTFPIIPTNYARDTESSNSTSVPASGSPYSCLAASMGAQANFLVPQHLSFFCHFTLMLQKFPGRWDPAESSGGSLSRWDVPHVFLTTVWTGWTVVVAVGGHSWALLFPPALGLCVVPYSLLELPVGKTLHALRTCLGVPPYLMPSRIIGEMANISGGMNPRRLYKQQCPRSCLDIGSVLDPGQRLWETLLVHLQCPTFYSLQEGCASCHESHGISCCLPQSLLCPSPVLQPPLVTGTVTHIMIHSCVQRPYCPHPSELHIKLQT